MNYDDFRNASRENGWPLAELTGSVPPCEEVETLARELGPAEYGEHVRRYARDVRNGWAGLVA